jgi:hypothetical protein
MLDKIQKPYAIIAFESVKQKPKAILKMKIIVWGIIIYGLFEGFILKFLFT